MNHLEHKYKTIREKNPDGSEVLKGLFCQDCKVELCRCGVEKEVGCHDYRRIFKMKSKCVICYVPIPMDKERYRIQGNYCKTCLHPRMYRRSAADPHEEFKVEYIEFETINYTK